MYLGTKVARTIVLVDSYPRRFVRRMMSYGRVVCLVGCFLGLVGGGMERTRGEMGSFYVMLCWCVVSVVGAVPQGQIVSILPSMDGHSCMRRA